MRAPLVSFHGGASAGSINNVVAFPEGGGEYDFLSTATLSAVVHPLKELRKFLFDPKGQSLYVANGSKELNQVLRFSPPLAPGKQWRYEGIFASKGLAHPFDLVFGFEGDLFVSSQDRNWVTRHPLSGAGGGVFAESFESVRGLAFDGSHIYIADPKAGRVYRYKPDGKKADHIKVKQPVHLLYDPVRKWLLIGSEGDNAVLAWSPTKPSDPPTTVVSGAKAAIDHTAGLALLPGSKTTASLYIVSRVGRQVLSFPLDFSSGRPVWKPTTRTVVLHREQLTDEPEFVGIEGGLYG
jgi:hypothetical protein